MGVPVVPPGRKGLKCSIANATRGHNEAPPQMRAAADIKKTRDNTLSDMIIFLPFVIFINDFSAKVHGAFGLAPSRTSGPIFLSFPPEFWVLLRRRGHAVLHILNIRTKNLYDRQVSP